MSIRKLDEQEEEPECNHPEHNPPTMIVFGPGLYENECPRCGLKQTFKVLKQTFKIKIQSE